MKTEVTFGEWLPSLADYKNPGLTEALNVLPGPDGYGPFPSKVASDIDLSASVIGAKRLERDDGTRVIVAGTTADLFVIVSGTATASSLGLSLASTDIWQFEQFGDFVFATTKNGDTYYLTDINSDTSFSAAPGSPPKANALARIGDFLFFGDLEDIDASDQPYRVRWSPFNNPAGTYETNIATQASFVDMPTRYGPVVGLSGGQIGLIFQKYGISRIQYVGGATAFRKEVVDEERGCVATGSIVRVGPVSYFLGHDGFCRSDGSQVDVVSSSRVWDWFRENSNLTFLSAVQGAVDWPNRAVVWAYYGADRTSFTGLLVYSWEQNKWSRVTVDLDWLVESTTTGTSLEDVASTYSNIDTMSLSLDSLEFAARGRVLSCFDGGVLNDFSGTAMQAMMETGDYQPAPGLRSFVSEVTPLIENIDGNTLAAVGTRERTGASVTFTGNVAQGSHGFIPFNADGRYFRTRLTVPPAANWDKCTGVQVEYVPSGRG